MKKYISVFVLVLLLAPAFGLAQTGWSNPPSNPPSCTDPTVPGCNPPINTSGVSQTKLGALVTSGFRSMLDLFVDGKLGVGTTNPGQAIEVVKNNSGEGPRVSLSSTDTTANQFSAFQFASGGTFKGGLLRRKSNDNIELFGAGNNNPSVVIKSTSGNVGIKNANPNVALDVSGSICYLVNGVRTCLGSDSDNPPPPGGDNPPPGDGIGSDILHTNFSGCAASVGCPVRSGSIGPTQSSTLVGDVGTLVMTCPSGYKVISGGAECDTSISVGFYSSVTAFLTDSRPISDQKWEVQCTKRLYTNWNFRDIIIRTAGAIKKTSITCAK